MLRRTRSELAKLRSQGAIDRVRDVLQLNGVSWRSQAELDGRLAALESAPPPGSAPAPAAAPAPAPVGRDHVARDVLAMQTWMAYAPPSTLTVSVILATRDRPDRVGRAVDSVLTQTHSAWELLVIDDSDGDETVAALARVDDDPRIRILRGAGTGSSTARNLGLEAAAGEAVAYLDDDNVMLPHWLAAVAWAFETHPDEDVLYGACVRELRPGRPELQFLDWDRRALLLGNLADLGALAHRRAHPEARFEESVVSCADWELLARLTLHRDPLRLPVVALRYTRDAPNRLSDLSPQQVDADRRRVRELIAQRRPLRVLGYNWMFPLITETYIGDELRSLLPHGAELAWYREQTPTSPMRVPEPVYDDVDRAVAEFGPDLLMLHWAGYAESQLPVLERLGIPFAVRMHGFDLDVALIARLQAHPLCVGVWTYPAEGFDAVGDHALSLVFTSVDRLPQPAPERDLILSVSAGLPKKDFPVLIEGLAAVAGVERRVVMGTTKGFNHIPGDITGLCEQYADPPLVQVNLDRDQVHALQARTAVQVYTLSPGVRFGMPMSIAEALCSGCAVVVPDRPECVAYAGPHARPYRTAADIARHCREVLAGGPAIEAERAANVAYGRERFCAPSIGATFHAQLTDAVSRSASRA